MNSFTSFGVLTPDRVARTTFCFKIKISSIKDLLRFCPDKVCYTRFMRSIELSRSSWTLILEPSIGDNPTLGRYSSRQSPLDVGSNKSSFSVRGNVLQRGRPWQVLGKNFEEIFDDRYIFQLLLLLICLQYLDVAPDVAWESHTQSKQWHLYLTLGLLGVVVTVVVYIVNCGCLLFAVEGPAGSYSLGQVTKFIAMLVNFWCTRTVMVEVTIGTLKFGYLRGVVFQLPLVSAKVLVSSVSFKELLVISAMLAPEYSDPRHRIRNIIRIRVDHFMKVLIGAFRIVQFIPSCTVPEGLWITALPPNGCFQQLEINVCLLLVILARHHRSVPKRITIIGPHPTIQMGSESVDGPIMFKPVDSSSKAPRGLVSWSSLNSGSCTVNGGRGLSEEVVMGVWMRRDGVWMVGLNMQQRKVGKELITFIIIISSSQQDSRLDPPQDPPRSSSSRSTQGADYGNTSGSGTKVCKSSESGATLAPQGKAHNLVMVEPQKQPVDSCASESGHNSI
ncbi:hypothetical protein Tco_0086689 [Tanacetum coccineum]